MRLHCQIGAAFLMAVLLASASPAQVIEFESGGLKYQTLTKEGITIMFAHMPSKVREYNILQVAISNGSEHYARIKPENFEVETASGSVIRGVPAHRVINQLIRSASSGDVVKLVTTYEMGLYGLGRISSASGYEKRRQSALAVVSSRKLKAAAAASAIAFVEMELAPGEATDGAVFYPTSGRTVGDITLRVYAMGQLFEFEPADTSLVLTR